MIKTSDEIEADLYRILDNAFSDILRGRVYRFGYRPIDSKHEDGIVAFLTGIDTRTEQSGSVIFNIYVPYVPYVVNNTMVQNGERVSELLKEIQSLKSEHLLNNTEYLFDIRTTPVAELEDEIQESRISVKINFRRKTF